MIRQDDDTATITDGGDSLYNPNYSIQSFTEVKHKIHRIYFFVSFSFKYSHRNYMQPHTTAERFSTKPTISTFKPSTNNPIIGFCQAEFQPLDPKLLFQSTDKTIMDNQSFLRCSQSVQLSTYDSGFVDEPTLENLTGIHDVTEKENSLPDKQKDEHMSMDDIMLTKSEEDDEEDSHDLILTELRNPSQQQWKTVAKRVSFLGKIDFL